jgi:proteasome assembly chaperone (PAC2) family protein
MGAVAQLSASYLAQALGARPLVELAVGEHFGASGVQVREGLIQPLRRPRTLLLEARVAAAPRDLVVLLAESQPAIGERRYCEQLLVKAREVGIARVYTFAAMATTASPSAAPRVFAAATDASILAPIGEQGAELLREGEIGGMNGYFLGIAAEFGMGGACILGEIPFFASNVPNPKGAAAVLRLFTRLARVPIDLGPLERQGVEVERQLLALQKHVEEWPAQEGALTPLEEQHIESLFRDATQDRAKAIELKAELDRLGIFGRYEDRFLDLFKRAG